MKRKKALDITENERKAIENIGKRAFIMLNLRFYNNIMCRTCKHKAVTLIARNKSKTILESICAKCQKAYEKMITDATP